jgi:endonuclease/exonuclease/phosphatase family metal-dependent hydrolase
VRRVHIRLSLRISRAPVGDDAHRSKSRSGRRARRALAGRLAGAALAASASLGAPAACRAPARPAAPAGALRALVYNIHAGADAAGASNLARVADVVRATGADVVLLQEVDRGTRRSGGVDQVATLARLTGFHAAFGSTLDYDGGTYGVALLSRWPIARDTLLRLPVVPPQRRAGGAYEPRGALHAEVRAPWGTLVVLNTHLDASRDDAYRLQEARALAALARAAAGAGGAARVLVGGDLNAEPESGVHALLRDAGLRDAWAACGQGDGRSYPASGPVKRIDYLYLGAAYGCAAARVLAGEASDHRAVLVDVTAERGR